MYSHAQGPAATGTTTPSSTTPKQTYAERTGTLLTVVENTPEVHNLVVCTLCRCGLTVCCLI